MFADDTQIDTSSNNIDSIANILNEDLINVSGKQIKPKC